jgi:hypothetical protein
MLLRPGASFELARQVQIGDALLGDVFSFCSGLYFRGKLTYARHFAAPPPKVSGAQIITPTRGLVPWDLPVGRAELEEFATVPVDCSESRYTNPLTEAAARLAKKPNCEFVLLGSVATGKYVDCLLPVLGPRLLFPDDFIGRGDMSRGALMLRQAKSGEELTYSPVAGAVRHGRRAPSVAQRKPAAGSLPAERMPATRSSSR